MTSQEETSSFRRFFRYVEDSCLHAYDHLVIQNASDISRESDRVRNNTNWTYLQEKTQKKKRQGEEIKRTDEEVAGATEAAYSGKHFRMGFMTMPAPQDRLPTPGQGFSVRSQSLNSVGGDDAADNRKQPPPKPKRDPNTKLSSSSEALNGVAATDAPEHEAHCHSCSDDYKKTPPPKPRRNPNTQLSSSFDDSHMCMHASHGKDPLQWEQASSQSQRSASGDDSESVYIEMVGNVLRALKSQEAAEDDENESVYEEMKYPALEDAVADADSCLSNPRIPQPFPNLLTHRPPLLVFPTAPAQCSPNSDESPLTPVDVTQLSMLEKATYSKSRSSKTSDEDRPTTPITSSGRSSAPPLPSNLYKSSSSSHNGHPRSQSACPSPVSMGRSPTPLNMKRPPPYEALMAGGNTPVSSSNRSQEGGAAHKNSSPYSSMQNVAVRLQTPTSPMDELTNTLHASGKQVVRKGSGGRRSKRCEESKCASKLGRSASTSGVSSPSSMPHHHPALSQMPWLCGDTTMMEMIEKKRVLCREIKCRQRPEKNLSKQDSMPILPSWRRKQPPPYSAPPTAASQSAAVVWDTAI